MTRSKSRPSRFRERTEIPVGVSCTYCDDAATCWDHVIPYSLDPNGPLTPSCQPCNLILSNKVFNSLEDRKKYVQLKRQGARRSRTGRVYVTKVCEHCDKEFETYRPDIKRFCSKWCATAARKLCSR